MRHYADSLCHGPECNVCERGSRCWIQLMTKGMKESFPLSHSLCFNPSFFHTVRRWASSVVVVLVAKLFHTRIRSLFFLHTTAPGAPPLIYLSWPKWMWWIFQRSFSRSSYFIFQLEDSGLSMRAVFFSFLYVTLVLLVKHWETNA